jgi:hypothetical protein
MIHQLAIVSCLLFFAFVSSEENICCMPRGHRVSVRDSSVTLKNCTESGCSSVSNLIMNYIHYPDLDNYRYRLDFRGEVGKGPFFEGTTLGFVTNKTSLLGFELLYNDKECSCRRTTKPSGIYHITCVTDALRFKDNISVGVGFKAQLYTSNTTKTEGFTTTEATHNFVAQNFAQAKPVPLCALVHEDTNNRETDSRTGKLISLSTRSIEIFDFTPSAADSSYIIPAHCPRSC